MKIDGRWVPESDEEFELMKRLHEAKVEAYQNGVNPDQIAAIMSFMASASLVEKPEEVELDEEELKRELKKEQSKAKNCPKCGEKIEDAKTMGIGGDFYLIPCGHEFAWGDRKELGPWVEDPTDNDEW